MQPTESKTHSQDVLEVRTEGGQCVRHELPAGQPVTIGRSAECGVQLEGTKVSRRHAELSQDSQGNWWLTDLNSRNGTHVNGEPIQRILLSAGDRAQIGDFEIRVVSPGSPDAQSAPGLQTTVWSVDDPDKSGFRTLRGGPAPRLQAGHLAWMAELGRKLVDCADERQRLVTLCRGLVDSDMRCDSAVVVRIHRDNAHEPPRLLCPVQVRHGVHHHLAGVSRAVVEAAVSGERPILAGGIVSSGLTVSFSEMDRGVTAIIACALRTDPVWSDVLYITAPHQFGTVDCLAVVALGVEQFKKAQLQIDARRNIEEGAALEYELRKARQMQMSLVPKNPSATGLEVAIGFEPCDWIGGDYVNVLPASDGRVFLAVADVSGKGLSAAMVAAGVHSIVHSGIRAGNDLGDLADQLNQYLLESMHRQSFVTWLGALFDPKSGSLQMVNAGHPPMLIVDRRGNVREMPYGINPPLGVVPMRTQTDFGELDRGDLLVMFTDGLSELIDPAGKMLGLEGVKDQIAALYTRQPETPLEKLSEALRQAMDEFRAGRKANDDRTFLLARWA